MKSTIAKLFLVSFAFTLVFTSCFKDDLLKEIDALKDTVSSMQRRNDSLSFFINAKADSLGKALTAAQKRSDSLASVLKTKSDSLSIALGITNSNLSALTKSVDSIKVQVGNINGQLTQLNNQLTSITSQLTQLNQQFGALGADYAALNTKYQELSTSLQNLNAQIASLQAEQLKLLERLNAILLQLNPPVDITTGLVAYYPFSGNAGDSSGNGNHGTANGLLSAAGKNGIANTAYLFSGNGSFINLPKPFFNGSRVSQFSLSVTFKVNQLSIPNGALWTKNGFWQGVGMYVGSDGTIAFSTSIPTFQYQGCASASNTIEINKWYNVTMVYDNINCSIYLNGNKIQTTSNTSSQSGAIISNTMAGFVDFAQSAGGNSNSTNLFGCGNSVSTGNTGFFNGIIDDFRLYNKILTQEQITYLATH
jgi:cell division protein FtsB